MRGACSAPALLRFASRSGVDEDFLFNEVSLKIGGRAGAGALLVSRATPINSPSARKQVAHVGLDRRPGRFQLNLALPNCGFALLERGEMSLYEFICFLANLGLEELLLLTELGNPFLQRCDLLPKGRKLRLVVQ